MRLFLILLTALFTANATLAEPLSPREGWVILETTKSHADLLTDLKIAVKANKMGVVTEAGPTGVAKSRGITIPENRVVGVFNNDFAVRILALSTAAMIEAPIRFYVTENSDGTATLSYKTPSFVFAPYTADAGPELTRMAEELDARFDAVAKAAIQ